MTRFLRSLAAFTLAAVLAIGQEGTNDLLLRFGRFDPLLRGPEIPPPLTAPSSTTLWIVQYDGAHVAAREAAAGARPIFHLPRHAALVRLRSEDTTAIRALPGVRWVGPYHPAYKIAPEHKDALAADAPVRAWNIVAAAKHDLATKDGIARDLGAAGGALLMPTVRESRLLTMTLPPDALRAALFHDDVVWVDPWSPPAADMDIARVATGAAYVATVVPGGFQGQDVRGEVPDIGCLTTHVDFSGVSWHSAATATNSHGTATYGIVFGKGVGNPMGLGLLPQGVGFAGFVSDPLYASNRYAYDAELLQPPYECVFQSNSTGGTWTTTYDSLSFLMDDIIFDLDLAIFQSQSNQGTQLSRPEAWAKNIVAVGGVVHQNTLTRADDAWSNSGSIGPAADGRIKPDLCNYYDNVFTTTSSSTTAYTSTFGGTSAATPIVAGSGGITIQMWAAGLFGPPGPGASVFAKRPHAATTKALLINNAQQYAFSGAGHDLTRTHQGWGSPDLVRTYDRAAAGKAFVVNESVLLPPLQSASYTVNVVLGEPDLRCTLVWSDPPGAPSASQHRVNDLHLRVTSPSGTVYWGNNGLLTGNWSSSGGSPNTIDTVENVFLQNPAAGAWLVTVTAAEINQDGHVETPALDADFALVVTGAALATPGPADTGQANAAAAALLVNGGTNLNGQNAFNGVPGPFFATAAPGSPLTFTWSGPVNADVVLVAGPLRRNNVMWPLIGSLDVGLLGPASVADVVILLDGINGTSPLDLFATTGPFGQATFSLTMPGMPPGVVTTFQAVVAPPGGALVLTAAFQLTVP